jgi:hypothetical protein
MIRRVSIPMIQMTAIRRPAAVFGRSAHAPV